MARRKKALLTGATGFVGSNLARRLVAEGFETHVIVRETSDKWRLEGILERLVEHSADLRNKEKLAAAVKEAGPDIIFHTAALGVFQGKVPSLEELAEGNLIATANLIDACDSVGYECFVNTGSSSEYGPKEKPMKESDACMPIDSYGITKCASTMYGQMAAKAGEKPIVCLRLFSPFGPFDDSRRMISYAVTQALKNKPLCLANPKAVRDFVFVEDICSLYLKAAAKAGALRGEIFNAGSGRQSTVEEVAGKIIEIAGSSSRVEWNSVKPRHSDAKMWEADISKAERMLGWKPKHGLKEGLKKTVKWFEENLDKYS